MIFCEINADEYKNPPTSCAEQLKVFNFTLVVADFEDNNDSYNEPIDDTLAAWHTLLEQPKLKCKNMIFYIKISDIKFTYKSKHFDELFTYYFSRSNHCCTFEVKRQSIYRLYSRISF